MLSGLATLHGCGRQAPAPVVHRTVDDVDGFDLVLDDARLPVQVGMFGQRDAVKANYAFFTYRGRTYRSVGGGSVVITDTARSPARFIVRETVIERGDLGTTRSRLDIVEKADGALLASRLLVRGEVEDGSGWTGDHAVRFVRRVLASTQRPARPWGVADYPPAQAHVVVLPAGEAAGAATRRDETAGCGGDARVARRPSQSVAVARGFEFLPSEPLVFAACDANQLLVASTIFSNELRLDLLSRQGTPLAQGVVRLPLGIDADMTAVTDVRLQAPRVEFVVHVDAGGRQGRPAWRGDLAVAARLIPRGLVVAPSADR